jgi:hypothetical protein
VRLALRTVAQWVACKDDVTWQLQNNLGGIGVVLTFAITVPRHKSASIPRVVKRAYDMLDEVKCFGLILPHSYTSPVRDPRELQPIDAELWNALQSNASLEVCLQPVVYEHNVSGWPKETYKNTVYPLDWDDLVSPIYDPAVPLVANQHHPWGSNIDFVISTSLSVDGSDVTLMPSLEEDPTSISSTEQIAAAGILGLDLLARACVRGDVMDRSLAAPKFACEQTVRMFGMSILVRSK